MLCCGHGCVYVSLCVCLGVCVCVDDVSAFGCLQAVLDEVAGRQVAVNNRAGRSSGQVEALLTHVDALLASNGNTLFTPSCQPAAVIQPARYLALPGVHFKRQSGMNKSPDSVYRVV